MREIGFEDVKGRGGEGFGNGEKIEGMEGEGKGGGGEVRWREGRE